MHTMCIYIYILCIYIYTYTITRIYILFTWIYIYIYTYIDHHWYRTSNLDFTWSLKAKEITVYHVHAANVSNIPMDMDTGDAPGDLFPGAVGVAEVSFQKEKNNGELAVEMIGNFYCIWFLSISELVASNLDTSLFLF